MHLILDSDFVFLFKFEAPVTFDNAEASQPPDSKDIFLLAIWWDGGGEGRADAALLPSDPPPVQRSWPPVCSRRHEVGHHGRVFRQLPSHQHLFERD